MGCADSHDTCRTSRYWAQIESGELGFFHRALRRLLRPFRDLGADRWTPFTGEREADLILTLTKSDITTFYHTFFSPASTTRSKLSILMRSQRLQPLALAPLLHLLQQQSTPLPAEQVEEARKTLEEGKPTLEEVRMLVARLFATEEGGVPTAVQVEFERLGKKEKLKDGTREIEEGEVDGFRAGLKKGEGVRPVGDFVTDLEAHL